MQSKYTLYTDMEAGVHNQLRGHQVVGSPRDGQQLQVDNPQRQAFEQQPDEPPTTPSSAAAPASFFPASTFGADAVDGESGTMPDSLKPVETKTTKGNERVEPYDGNAAF